MDRKAYTVTGMDCGECAAKIDHAVSRLRGVDRVVTNFGSSRMVVSWDPEQTSEQTILRTVHGLGFETHNSLAEAQRRRKSEAVRRMGPVVVSGVSVILGAILGHLGSPATAAVFQGIAIIIGFVLVGRRALASLRSRVLDINVLMTVAVIGAVMIRRMDEAAVVYFLFILGEWLEEYAVDRTRGSVLALMELAPPTARILRNGGEVDVPAESVRVGDIARIRPGETIPVDGEVIAHESVVNESTLTGESAPVRKGPGDQVFAGTFNQDGALDVCVTRLSNDNTVARIVEMVQSAQSGNSRSERWVNRFSRVYTPIVLSLAVVAAVLAPFVSGVPWDRALYSALTLLVAACPCALVISTPVAIVSALGVAARQGILIKSGAALEELSRVRSIIFDKTGTLTEGYPTVLEVVPAPGVDEDALVAAAAAVESRASHPLADSLRRYARDRSLDVPEVAGFVSEPGRGVSGVVHGTRIWVGNENHGANGTALPSGLDSARRRLEETGCSVLFVAAETGTLGLIGVKDRPRPGVAEHIAELRSAGIRRMALLSGDAAHATRSLASALGIPEAVGQLLPEQKRDAVTKWRNREPVAMVGDGINDAPALAAANVGIAMGAAGSDAAISAADIALMGDDLGHVTEALTLGRRTASVVRQNVAIALGLKAAFLLAIAVGHATLWMAVIADMGASLLVTLNALRLMRRPDRYRPRRKIRMG